MTITLRLESMHDDPEQCEFDEIDEAIAFAKQWFLEGYADETMGGAAGASAADQAERIADDLKAGREFAFTVLHQRISIAP